MSLLGSVFGDAKDGPDKQTRNLGAQQEQQLGFLMGQTNPVFAGLSSRYQNFLNGGLDVTGMPQYAALKDSAEQQYGQAKDNLLSTVQPGGNLTNALAGLERGRASTMTQGVGDLANQEMARTFGFATGQTPVSLGGLNSAYNTAAYSSAAAGAQQGAANRQLGSAIGNYLSRSNTSTGSKGSGSNASSALDGAIQ